MAMTGAKRLAALMLATTALFTGEGGFPGGLAAQAQERRFDFAIPARPVPQGLNEIGRVTGLSVVLQGSTARSAVGRPVSGSLTAREALARLLAGTGLRYDFTNANTVTVLDPASPLPAGAPAADDSLLLDTIDVTAGSTGGAAAAAEAADLPYTTPGSSSYISAEQIERFRGAAPGDIFKGTPGVIAAGNHNGAKLDVNIRGMQGQNRVKVAIDGTQQASTTWRGYIGVDERVYIDPDLIGGVTVEKGPTSGAEGAGTPGGVVSIRTLSAQDIVQEGEEVGLRLRVGTSDNAIAPPHAPTYDQRTDAPSFFDFENGSGSLAFGVTKESYDFVVAAARRETGNYFAGSEGDDTHYTFNGMRYPLSFTKPGEEVFNSSESTLSGLVKGTFRFDDDHSLQLGYTHFESQFGESMGSLFFQQDNGFRQVKLSDIATDTYTARYRWNPADERFDLTANFWATDVSGTTRAVAAALGGLEQYGYIPADEPRYSEVLTYGADATNISRFQTEFGALRFDYGASYVIEDMDGDEYCSRIFTRDRCVWLQPSIGKREIGSLFSSGEWKANDWLTFYAGLRYDTYRLEDNGPKAVPGEDEKDGGGLSPSIGVTLSPVPIEGLQFFGTYSEGFRPPTMREAMVSDANAIPNWHLEPETTQSWEFGMNYLKDGVLFDRDKARLKIAYFHNYHDNYISRVPSYAGGGQYAFTFTNLDHAMFEGLEVSGSYDTGVFFSNAALTYYTDYEFCFTTRCEASTVETDYAANHIPPELSASVTLGLRLSEERLTLGSRITYNSERLAALTVSDRQRTAFWLPYTVVDAFATYKINDHLTLDVKGENLFDRYYVDALDGWMPAPGRTIRANLTATF